jgi:hypothetical protein
MLIRRRYSNTIMSCFRRNHLPHWVIWNRYHAFKLRQKHGVRAPWSPWHKRKVPLTKESIIDAIIKIARYE